MYSFFVPLLYEREIDSPDCFPNGYRTPLPFESVGYLCETPP